MASRRRSFMPRVFSAFVLRAGSFLSSSLAFAVMVFLRLCLSMDLLVGLERFFETFFHSSKYSTSALWRSSKLDERVICAHRVKPSLGRRRTEIKEALSWSILASSFQRPFERAITFQSSNSARSHS